MTFGNLHKDFVLSSVILGRFRTIFGILLQLTHKFLPPLTRCSRDNTLKYTYEQKSEQFFSVAAFRFKEGYDDVFIHCKLTVCREDDSGSRCARGCEGGRRRRSINEEDVSVRLTIGPMKLTNKKDAFGDDAGK